MGSIILLHHRKIPCSVCETYSWQRLPAWLLWGDLWWWGAGGWGRCLHLIIMILPMDDCDYSENNSATFCRQSLSGSSWTSRSLIITLWIPAGSPAQRSALRFAFKDVEQSTLQIVNLLYQMEQDCSTDPSGKALVEKVWGVEDHLLSF